MVFKNLRQWKDCLDCEPGIAEEGDVCRRTGDKGKKEVDREKGGCQVGEELVVADHALATTDATPDGLY